ncbi:hypothetical protein DPMN_119754 [Dreissena polymorpha]|uniref:Uncharacterized protein n=1 Tax=Dreissena polymorpha TaxID=45954 RepID=A0A9D4GMA1_DREPO|nr:hypothetical protein DPMN_119754 [Dreissena polymorpha]
MQSHACPNLYLGKKHNRSLVHGIYYPSTKRIRKICLTQERERRSRKRKSTSTVIMNPLNLKPSTSGMGNVSGSDDESIDDDEEVCCVYGKFYLPNDDTRQYVKIMIWTYCDK